MHDARRANKHPTRSDTMNTRTLIISAIAALSAPSVARAQSSPAAAPTEVQCQAASGAEHEAALNRLAASPRFAVAIDRCESGASTRCGAYRCLASGQLAASVELEGFLSVGADAAAGAQGSARVDDSRGLGESVDSLASASALFEVVTQGLASFLVERARVELQRGVTDRIRAEACGDDVPLSNTCGLLGSPEQAMAGPTFGAGLRTAFERDVIELPRWALAHAGPVTDEASFARRFGLAFAAALARRSTPAAVADALEQELSTWTQPEAIINPTREGLRAYKRIAFAMAVAASHGDRLSPSTRARLVQIVLGTSLRGRAVADSSLPTLFELARRAHDAQRAADDLGNPSLSESTRRTRIATLALNLSSALRLTIALANGGASVGPVERGLDSAGPLFDAMATGDVARVFAATAGMLRALVVPLDARASISLRVLALGAEFASARTARQAEAAISAFAAPPGSWQGKHEHPGLWLNGFVGVGGGAEVLFGSAGISAGAYIAPYAPVGLDLTRPLGTRSWAFGVFIPVIDLGALVNASTAASGLASPMGMGMMGNPRTQTSPGQFLAPGLYARLNIARSPLVLSVGANVMPFGREVDYGGGRTETIPALRAGASLSIDIPIVPFSF
jgi:hypothetical protein